MVAFQLPPSASAPQHEGTEHLAINNTLLRRTFTRLAVKTLGRLHKSYGHCIPISRRMIVKSSWRTGLTEAATMEFIERKTSIPVPHVYCSFVHKGQAYILMERLDGQHAPKALSRLPESGRQKVYEQLRNLIREMRSLSPPDEVAVGSCVGGRLYDSRMQHSLSRFGPFKKTQEFHLWIREGLQPSKIEGRERDEDWQGIEKMAEMQDGSWPSSVFTHGDLNPSNILVRGDRVVGIIDWEFAGWYPPYWEYTSSYLGNIMRTDWQADLEEFLETYPEELEMERIRQKWWGDI